MASDLTWDVRRRDDGTVAFTCRGSLTIWSVPEMRAAIREILPTTQGVAFDLTGVESADVAGLQVLCAAHRQAVRDGKFVAMEAGAPVRDVAAEAGFLRHVGCDAGCLWRSGGDGATPESDAGVVPERALALAGGGVG